MSASPLILHAPVDGVVVPLGEIPDPVFADGVLGDGIALDPLDECLYAPCDGEVVQCARTRHAVTLKTQAGVELLLHLGLDTVELGGEGIELLVAVGDRVSTGAPLCRFDADRIAQRASSLITPLIVTAADGWRLAKPSLAGGARVVRGEPLLELAQEVSTVAVTVQRDATGPTATRRLTLALRAGLHARPAARLRDIARRHAVSMTVEHGGGAAEADSISTLLNLGIVEGDALNVTARGERAEAALEAVETLLTTLEADDHTVPSQTVADDGPLGEGELVGLVAGPGLAVGPLVAYCPPLPRVPREGEGEATEWPQLQQALSRAGEALAQAEAQAARQGHHGEAEIFGAHRAWLEDPALTEAALAAIRAGRSAGQAWREALDDEAERLAGSGNSLLSGRIADLRDLQQRVMALLAEPGQQDEAAVPEGAIVVADELTPSQLVALAKCRLAGLCLARSGTTAHVAILARARGIPCLVSMGAALDRARSERAVLDGERGRLEVSPSAARLAEVEASLAARRHQVEEERRAAHLPAVTLDARRVEVCANVGSPAEAEMAAQAGADGIGLLRSEFLFLERSAAPGEDDQAHEYQASMRALGGKPVIVRTLDIGADKQLPYLPLPAVANPALGVRGVRLWQRLPQLLETQLRALLRVEPLGSLRIMLPMVSEVSELVAVRRHLDSVAQELGLTVRPQLGVMVEVPSAALCAASLAEEADFLSIGTNDLTQYTLAMDREDPDLAARADVLHPAVLKLVQVTVEGAAGRCPVGVCGAAAGDPLASLVLVALGVDELSVEPARVPAVKAAVRRLDAGRLAAELPALLGLADAAAVRARLTSWQTAQQDTTTTITERLPS
ncbi:phosphoenolpyruvate--protein phosphotransferase [Billgrantia antri]|uniref:phosphoenolpyruvate--protein phosphotransferase n=1 Tax=Halomonas sulfidivorans TaxID=2733488 RepID=A0ABX7WDR8_9GAMM|nr:phosphoenolpyruvate--protein phosphotransferase [Halomonas sulfidivorans]QTP58524.1 phosphoenolpyruvate--protein phosphotransferase [Halomonas sulfidivorans]